jgi:translation initiation factor IF-2
MSDPNQIRINELARELEIKAKVLIEFLPEIGVTEKKTHSSSLDLDHAELVRKHFQAVAAQEAAAEVAKEAAKKGIKPAARPAAPPAPAAQRPAPASAVPVPARPTVPAATPPVSRPVSTPGSVPAPAATAPGSQPAAPARPLAPAAQHPVSPTAPAPAGPEARDSHSSGSTWRRTRTTRGSVNSAPGGSCFTATRWRSARCPTAFAASRESAAATRPAASWRHGWHASRSGRRATSPKARRAASWGATVPFSAAPWRTSSGRTWRSEARWTRPGRNTESRARQTVVRAQTPHACAVPAAY